MIIDTITQVWDQHGILSPAQYGFRPKHGTDTELLHKRLIALVLPGIKARRKVMSPALRPGWLCIRHPSPVIGGHSLLPLRGSWPQ